MLNSKPSKQNSGLQPDFWDQSQSSLGETYLLLMPSLTASLWHSPAKAKRYITFQPVTVKCHGH